MIASHYARPLPRGCGVHSTFVRTAPSSDSDAVSELLPGEGFEVLEYTAGWAWGFCTDDHAVGYVEGIALTEPAEPTHVVCEKCAPIAPDDRITSPVLASLPMGARLHGQEQGACLSTELGCISLSHLRPADEHDDDPVVVAERLIGALYLEGGRTFQGIDGPGLVQLSLSLCGHPAPRLADLQADLGGPLSESDPLRRADLVLFDGDCGLMIDDLLMIHASPSLGKVAVEPVAVIDRPGRRARRLGL